MNPARSLVRALLSGLAAAVLATAVTGVAGQSASAPAAASAAATAPSDGALPAPALQLRYVTVPLPTARQGEAYERRRIVTGGTPPYEMRVVAGELPPGMAFAPDGTLAGRPEVERPPRSFSLTLEVRDAGSPPQTLRQSYQLHVAAPRAAPRPRPAAPPPLLVRPEDAELLASQIAPGRMSFYRLEADDLDVLAGTADEAAAAPATEGVDALPFTLDALQSALAALGLDPGSAGAAAASGSAAPLQPAAPAARPLNRAQLRELLQPLVGVEYPTRWLFDAALHARHCAYWQLLVRASAQRQGRQPPALDCAAMARARPEPARGAGWTPKAFFDALLPQDLREQAVTLAREERALDQVERLSWRAADCGCVRSLPYDIVYGVMPFWHATPAAPPVDFSRFHRISVLGVQFDGEGVPIRPAHWDRDLPDLVRTAWRHDARLDLVVQRSEWASITGLPPAQRTALAQRAAAAAVTLVGTPLAPAGLRLLLPAWNEPRRAFDGLTVMFEDPPGAERLAVDDPVRSFLRSFVDAALTAMRQQRRELTLNIVVPDHWLGRDGADRVPDLLAMLDSAAARPADTPAITVRLLVQLREPTQDTKKQLIASIDRHPAIQNHHRVPLLESIIVMSFPPADAALLDSANAGGFSDDLAYYQWVYGGVGLWPLPVAGIGAGDALLQRLAASDAQPGDGGLSDRACGWVCPRRSGARAAFEALLAVTALALVVYLAGCRVRRFGPGMVAALWALGLATLLVGGALLRCDPQLKTLREGNLPLAVLLMLLAGLGLWFSIRPRVPRP